MKIDQAEIVVPDSGETSTTAPGPLTPRSGYLAPRLAQLVAGLTAFGFSIAMVVHAGLGVSPWDVLSQGLALATGWTFGLVTCAVGVVVLLAWWPLRTRPGVGTVLNVIIVGLAADLGLAVLARLPEPLPFAARVALLGGGVVLLALASGAYLAARLGPGPRDGLMTGLHDRFGWPIAVARAVVELAVLALGWALGGDVGLGTLAFALLVGPLCGLTIPWFAGRAPWLRV